MELKFVKAFAIVYGNYRAALARCSAVFGEEDEGASLLEVISTAKALLALQEALDFDLVEREVLEAAIVEARESYEAN